MICIFHFQNFLKASGFKLYPFLGKKVQAKYPYIPKVTNVSLSTTIAKRVPNNGPNLYIKCCLLSLQREWP